MPPLPWKTLTSREVYRNKWIRVREDLAEMPNGRTTIYGVCEIGVARSVEHERTHPVAADRPQCRLSLDGRHERTTASLQSKSTSSSTPMSDMRECRPL